MPERHSLPKITQEEISDLSRPVCLRETESMLNRLPRGKVPGPRRLTGESHGTRTGDTVPSLHSLCGGMSRGAPPNSSCSQRPPSHRSKDAVREPQTHLSSQQGVFSWTVSSGLAACHVATVRQVCRGTSVHDIIKSDNRAKQVHFRDEEKGTRSHYLPRAGPAAVSGCNSPCACVSFHRRGRVCRPHAGTCWLMAYLGPISTSEMLLDVFSAP